MAKNRKKNSSQKENQVSSSAPQKKIQKAIKKTGTKAAPPSRLVFSEQVINCISLVSTTTIAD